MSKETNQPDYPKPLFMVECIEKCKIVRCVPHVPIKNRLDINKMPNLKLNTKYTTLEIRSNDGKVYYRLAEFDEIHFFDARAFKKINQ